MKRISGLIAESGLAVDCEGYLKEHTSVTLVKQQFIIIVNQSNEANVLYVAVSITLSIPEFEQVEKRPIIDR